MWKKSLYEGWNGLLGAHSSVFGQLVIPLLDFSEIFREVSIFHGRICGVGVISGKNLKIARLGGQRWGVDPGARSQK